MIAIKDAYLNAILADAVYALDDNLEEVRGEDLIELLKTRMTMPLSEYIAGNFYLVSNIDSDAVGMSGSGFDASVE